MNAGLPITGITGIFYIVSALVALMIETSLTLFGKSSINRWRGMLPFLGISLGMTLVFISTAFILANTLSLPPSIPEEVAVLANKLF